MIQPARRMPAGANGARMPQAAPPPPREARAGLPLKLLALLWFLVLYDVHWLLASRGIPVLKAPIVVYLALGAAVAWGFLNNGSWQRRWTWYPPFAAFIATGALMIPFALNRGMARDNVQGFILFWFLVVSTVLLVDSARRAERLLRLYGLQFVWFGLWGSATGLVGWHTTLANHDGFGSFMAIGLGFTAFMYFASKEKWFRRAMLAALALCAVGVVASFARGAFLAAAGVFGVVWLRSPHKGRTLGMGIGAAILVIAASQILYPGQFWAEISSVFDEGTTEGTGEDRWVLWAAAWEVYLNHPILGTGPGNWGVFASTHFVAGELGSRYVNNPTMLYNRSLHSEYFRILAEQGTVGVMAFVWILWDFWKRNAKLRTQQAQQVWAEMGGKMNLQSIAYGLEAALVAWMAVSAIYSQSGKHWFYTIIGLNLLIGTLVTRGMRRSPPRSAPLVAPELVRRGAPTSSRSGSPAPHGVAPGVMRNGR